MSRMTNEQQWLVNLSGPLAALNNLQCDTLETDDMSDEDAVHGSTSSFKRDWDISNRGDLEGTLDWLARDGHRTSYQRLYRRWNRLSESALESQVRQLQDQQQANQIRLVHLHRFVLSGVGISAWDFGRYAYLCRSGYFVGLFNEDQAWQALRRIAPAVRGTFKDWEHYGISYAVGRLYWTNTSPSESNCRDAFQPINKLLGDPHSGWNRLAWNGAPGPVLAEFNFSRPWAWLRQLAKAVGKD